MTQEEIIKQLQDRINEQSAENEELRSELSTAESISYDEIAELQSLADYIEPGDIELLEWAGVPEDNQ